MMYASTHAHMYETAYKLPVENAKHLNFEWRWSRVGRELFCSEVTLFEYNVSIILSPIDIYD